MARDAGQKRVPAPPAMMTAKTFCMRPSMARDRRKVARKRSVPYFKRVGRLAAAFVSWTLVLSMLFGVAACRREQVPPLVEIAEVSPRELEIGDHVEIRGAGFPQGRKAKVTFEGTVRKPGVAAAQSVSIESDGIVASTARVEVVVREALEEGFCGKGDQAAHATFEGAVRVAFSSTDPDAVAPLGAVLRGVSLDVRPAELRADLAGVLSIGGIRIDCDLATASRDDSSIYRQRYRPNENPLITRVDLLDDGDTLLLDDRASRRQVRAGATLELSAGWASSRVSVMLG
jgi:hypothetical protein